eukprot:1350820-Lingulodinium_polyedra.AAC.1
MNNASPVLQPRVGIPVPEKTTFELICEMSKQGWMCVVKEKAGKQGRNETPEMQPYKVGGPKVWWVTRNQISVCDAYLKALLSATDQWEG